MSASLQKKRKKKFDNIFKQYDINKDGYLNRREVRKMLQSMFRRDVIRPEEIDFVLNLADHDRNGRINPDEIYIVTELWQVYDKYRNEIERVVDGAHSAYDFRVLCTKLSVSTI